MKYDAAVFDIDGTLLPMSLERMLIACMLSNRAISLSHLFRELLAIAFEKGGVVKFLRNKFYIEGLEAQRVHEIIDSKCWTEIKNRFFRSMIEIIELFRESGTPIVLLSGTIDIIAERVRDFINSDYVLSSKLEVVNGIFTGKVVGIYPYREGKVAVLREVVEKEGWDWGKIWAFGDSPADLPLLKAVGHPVAVNPSKRLRQKAKEMGWPILDVGPRMWNPFSRKSG